MDLTAAIAAFESEKELFIARKRELAKNMQQQFSAITQPLFDNYPLLTSFSWKQYTPYFNDGDTRTFGVNNDYLNITYNDAEWEEVASYSFRPYDNRVTEEMKQENFEACFTAIQSFLRAIPEELYEDMFGDHVRVTVTAGGVSMDDIDHD